MILLLSTALAGGYYYSDSGIVASGRGGAWIAGADNQFAQYYNPAGLIRVTEPIFNLGVGLVQQNVSFDRLDDDGTFQPTSTNAAKPFGVPQMGFATPLITDKLAFAFGMVSPYAPSATYAPTGAQRYSVIDTEIYLFTWGPSLAYQPHPMFTIGLGLQANVLVLEQSLNISAAGTLDPGGDIGVRARATDAFTPNMNLGVLFEPDDALSIGLAVQPGSSFAAKGDAVLDLSPGAFGGIIDGDIDAFQDGNCEPSQVDPVCSNPDGITLEIKLPLVLRAGVAVRPRENLELEIAVVWQNWSSLGQITITDVDPQLTMLQRPVAIDSTFVLPANLGNTTSLRLGGDWRPVQLLKLRAGGFYENGGFPDERLTVALYDPWKVQVGGGASIYPAKGRFRFDVAMNKLFYPSKKVRSSEIQQVYVDLLGTGRTSATIGNGDYRSDGWIAALQANVLLGALP